MKRRPLHPWSRRIAPLSRAWIFIVFWWMATCIVGGTTWGGGSAGIRIVPTLRGRYRCRARHTPRAPLWPHLPHLRRIYRRCVVQEREREVTNDEDGVAERRNAVSLVSDLPIGRNQEGRSIAPERRQPARWAEPVALGDSSDEAHAPDQGCPA